MDGFDMLVKTFEWACQIGQLVWGLEKKSVGSGIKIWDSATMGMDEIPQEKAQV